MRMRCAGRVPVPAWPALADCRATGCAQRQCFNRPAARARHPHPPASVPSAALPGIVASLFPAWYARPGHREAAVVLAKLLLAVMWLPFRLAWHAPGVPLDARQHFGWAALPVQPMVLIQCGALSWRVVGGEGQRASRVLEARASGAPPLAAAAAAPRPPDRPAPVGRPPHAAVQAR